MNFITTKSSLYNNDNKVNIPSWMDDTNIENISDEKETLDLEFDVKGAFADKVGFNREQRIADTRDLVASFDTSHTINKNNAKISIASFLSGKYFSIRNIECKNNKVSLSLNIDGYAGDFLFDYHFDNGKLKENNTFFVKQSTIEGEYPFSKAGLNECLDDIKKNKIKTPMKVLATNKYCIISKEEIVRRYNGKLREATERINELVKNGELMGVSSNSYGSVYDVEYLFPQMEKEEKMPEKLSSFDFVENTEHIETNPYKNEKVLATEANSILSKFFNDYSIINCARDDNELLLKANILLNGLTKTCDFCFEIKNDKVNALKIAEYNNERLTLEQLIEKFNMNNDLLKKYVSENKSMNRIYSGSVLTSKDINRKLGSYLSKESIKKVIDNWLNRKLITCVNSTTYTTNSSFEDLLSKTNISMLSEKEMEKIKEASAHFGEELKFSRIKEKDNGTRQSNNAVASDESNLVKLQSCISDHFKQFEISDFNKIEDNKYSANICFLNKESNVRNSIKVFATFDVNRVTKISALINDKNVELNKVVSAFSKNALLSNYINSNIVHNASKTNKIIVSEKMIFDKLDSFTSKENIEKTILSWEKRGLIKRIGFDKFASNLSFEELLSKTSVSLLSKEEIDKIKLVKQYFGKNQMVNRESAKDTGSRIVKPYVNDNVFITAANEHLLNNFNNFSVLSHKINKNNLIYEVELFDSEYGLKTPIKFDIEFNDNKIASCNAIINNEKVSIDNIKNAFSLNDTLKKYLQMNKSKKVNSSIIMSKKDLINKLSKIVDVSNVDSIILNWEKNGNIEKINSTTFASKNSFEQLLANSNIKLLNQEQIMNNMKKSSRTDSLLIKDNYDKDSGSRSVKKIEEKLSPKMEVLKNKLANRVNVAYLNKKITLNKHAKLNEMLDNSKNPNDLEKVHIELEKYFK